MPWSSARAAGISGDATRIRRPCVRSHAMPRLVCLVMICAAVSAARGAAPPARLSASQGARLKQAQALLGEANQLRKAGKATEAIAAAEKMLAIERGVYGDDHAEVAASLGFLAGLHAGRGGYLAAARAYLERERVLARLWGPENHRVVDARWKRRDAETTA